MTPLICGIDVSTPSGQHSERREQLFMSKVKVDSASGCWIWTAARDNGYAVFGQWRWRGSHSGYRWAYEHFIGPIPEGAHIDHTCGRGRDGCVNPNHLEPVTQAENNRRTALRRGLDGNTCKRGHVGELTRRKSGPKAGEAQSCNACRRENHRRKMAK